MGLLEPPPLRNHPETEMPLDRVSHLVSLESQQRETSVVHTVLENLIIDQT